MELNYDNCLKLAEQGDAKAQYELGNMYYYGKIKQQNFEKAAKWYKKAFEQINSKIVYQSLEDAIYWYEKSIEHEQ